MRRIRLRRILLSCPSARVLPQHVEQPFHRIRTHGFRLAIDRERNFLFAPRLVVIALRRGKNACSRAAPEAIASKISSGSSGMESNGIPSASTTAFTIAGAGPSIGKLADAFRAISAVRIAHLLEENPNRRQVRRSGHDVIRHLGVLHAPVAPFYFLIQRKSDSLRDAAGDLPLGQNRIEHLADFLQAPRNRRRTRHRSSDRP